MESVWDDAIRSFAAAAASSGTHGSGSAGGRGGTGAQRNTVTIGAGGHLMVQDRAEDVANAIRAWLSL